MKSIQTWETDGLQFCPICSREQKEEGRAGLPERDGQCIRFDGPNKRERIKRNPACRQKQMRQTDRQRLLRRRMFLRVLGFCLLVTLCINTGVWGIKRWKKENGTKERTEDFGGEFFNVPGKETAAEAHTNVDSAVLAQRGNENAAPAVTSTRRAPSDSFDPEDPLLILVNKENELPKDYEVDLTELKSGLASVATVMYEALMEMLEDGGKEGLHFVVCSGYRSPKRQQELLDEDIRSCMASGMSYEEAYDEVTRFTMPPGFSEHSTGLAADIVALDYQLLDEGQEKTAENRWLRENAWKYGFILRYPADKEEITQIDYESWHFRYVGKEAAKYMYEEKLTLEEFLGAQS